MFDITSRDQGWGGSPVLQRPYAQSFTWFDAGLERFDRTIECVSLTDILYSLVISKLNRRTRA